VSLKPAIPAEYLQRPRSPALDAYFAFLQPSTCTSFAQLTKITRCASKIASTEWKATLRRYRSGACNVADLAPRKTSVSADAQVPEEHVHEDVEECRKGKHGYSANQPKAHGCEDGDTVSRSNIPLAAAHSFTFLATHAQHPVGPAASNAPALTSFSSTLTYSIRTTIQSQRNLPSIAPKMILMKMYPL